MKRDGIRTLVLVGASELDFLIDFACERHQIAFLRTTDLRRAQAAAKRSEVIVLCGDTEVAATSRYKSVQDILASGSEKAGTE